MPPIVNNTPYPIDDEIDDDEINNPNKHVQLTATVFGKRLQKKLQDELEAARLQKQQLPILPDPLNNVQNAVIPIKNNSTKDNKENHQIRNPVNGKIEDDLTKKSIKRSNESQSDMQCEKRQKLDENEVISNNSENKIIIDHSEHFCPAPSDAISTDNERSGTLRFSTRTKNDEERYKRRSDDKRNERRYRKRYNDCHSRRKDSSTDRRKYPCTRSKALQDEWDDKSKRFDDKKSDLCKDSKENNDKRRESDCNRDVGNLRDRNQYRRRDRNERRIDERRSRDDHSWDRKRGGSSEHNHRSNDRPRSREGISQINESTRTRRYSRDRTKKVDHSRSRDHSNKNNIDNNDQQLRFLQDPRITRIIGPVKAEKIQRNYLEEKDKEDINRIDSKSLNSLEDGEILDSPGHSPHRKNSKNDAIFGRFSPTPSSQKDDEEINVDYLLDALSRDCEEFEPADSDLVLRLTPLREEKIENIEAFIRDYKTKEIENNLSNEKNNKQIKLNDVDICNTTVDIAETLADNVNEIIVKDESAKVSIINNIPNDNSSNKQENNDESVKSEIIKNLNHTTEQCKDISPKKSPIIIDSRPFKIIEETNKQAQNVIVQKSQIENQIKPTKAIETSQQQTTNVKTIECLKKDDVELTKKITQSSKEDVIKIEETNVKEIENSVNTNEKKLDEAQLNSVSVIKSILEEALINPPKRKTITVNNINTNYTTILSKYPRKKKNSISSDTVVNSVEPSNITDKININETQDVPQVCTLSSITEQPVITSTITETISLIRTLNGESQENTKITKHDENIIDNEKQKITSEVPKHCLINSKVELSSKNDKNEVNIKSPIKLKDVTTLNSKETYDSVQQSDKISSLTKTELITLNNDSDNKSTENLAINNNNNNNNTEIKIDNELNSKACHKTDIPFQRLNKVRKVTIIKPTINDDNQVKPSKSKKCIKKTSQVIKPQECVIKVVKRKRRKELTDSSSSVTLIFSGHNLDNDICDSAVKR